MSFHCADEDRMEQTSGDEEPGQTMKNPKPLFDPETHYRIEVRGRVDVDWLQSFDVSVGINLDEAGLKGDTTVLDVHTDQSGFVGLVRRLHGLGITIQQVQIISEEGEDESPHISFSG
jgi:hypothetical protein